MSEPNLPSINPLTRARKKRAIGARLQISNLLDELDLDSAEEILVLTDLVNSRLTAGVFEHEQSRLKSLEG